MREALDRLDRRVPARLRRPDVVLLAIAVVFAGAAAVRADRVGGGADGSTVSDRGAVSGAPAGEALVWFHEPLTPEEAAAAVTAGDVEARGLRVELTGPGEPDYRDVAVPEGAVLQARMEMALEALAGALREEAAELRGYAATTDMADFTAQYVADAERLEALAAREPATCACIAAVLVRDADPGGLRERVPGADRVEIPGQP